jgi:cell division protein FtsA
MEKYIAAVDLGTSRITVIVGKQTASKKFHVLAHHETPSPKDSMESGEILNDEQVGRTLKALTGELRTQVPDIDISEVYVGVSGKHIHCARETEKTMRSSPDVSISEKEIRNLEEKVRSRAGSDRKVLDIIPQAYHIDKGRSVMNPVGMRSHRLEAEFCVLTAAISPMESITRSIQQAGLQVKGMFLSPLAAAEAVLSDDEKEVGVAVVDIGGGTTSLTVYHNNILRHVYVLPFGGEDITGDIQKGCAIPLRHAEQLKVQYGSCYSDLVKINPTYTIPVISGGEVSHRMLTKTIESRVEEIIEVVDYIIQGLGYNGKLGAGIVFTGGGAKLGDLTEFAGFKTGMKARKGTPLFVTSDSVAEVQHSDYATTVGLLMKGATCKEPECVPVPVEVEPGLFPVGAIETKQTEKTEKTKRPERPERRRTPGIGTVIGTRIRQASTEIVNGAKGIFDEFFQQTDNRV